MENTSKDNWYNNVSTSTIKSTTSLRCSSKNKNESINKKIDHENGSKGNSLQCTVVEGSGKGSIELQDICGIRHVGSNIAVTIL